MFVFRSTGSRVVALPLLACSFVTAGAVAQNTQGVPASAASDVRKARALYYTPVDSGLQGFHCEVNFDWKEFMERAANAPVPDGDARLGYLKGIKLSVDEDLNGQGRLNWEAASPPPEGTQDSVDKVRGGMQQLWSGFFQTWGGFFTGNIVELDGKASVEKTAAGYHVSMREAGSVVEEQYDPKLLLQTVHVTTPSVETTMAPTFSPGPHGLLVSSIRSVYRQPPTADPTEVVMGVNYAPVGGFQIPSELKVAVGPAGFDFHLVNCVVRSQLTVK